MIITFFIIALLIITIRVFMSQAKFGKIPSGKRLEKIKLSPHYNGDSFKNMNHTPDLTEGVTYPQLIKEFFFDRKPRVNPVDKIPVIKTDLKNIDIKTDALIWVGHSSYFIQIDGKRILVDPVFSGAATPLPVGTKAFIGSNIYSADDMPEIDYLFISHDHWDHLDYDTIKKIKSRVKTVICGLGVGEHLEHWGYNPNSIIEKGWNEEIVLADGFVVNTTTARHFSGRGFVRNKALWLSFVLQTPSHKLFLGGDSGYDNHFADIGNKFGPFDLVILENGQYDHKWKYIHLMPTEILQAAKDLKAKKVLPVHSSKFMLGSHSWDEPLELIIKNNETENLHIITPMIGEQVNLKDTNQTFTHWWKSIN